MCFVRRPGPVRPSTPVETRRDEEDIPAPQDQAAEYPRLSRADGHQGRSHRAEPPSGEGAQAAVPHHLREVGDLPAGAAPSAGRARFGKALRLRKRSEFLETQRCGMRRPGRFLVVIVARRQEGPTRLGVTVSRKVGPAVVRNRVKRLVREAFRLHRHELPAGLDLVVVARHGASEATLGEILRELLKAVGSARKPSSPRRGEPC